jgi:hypothetical protein
LQGEAFDGLFELGRHSTTLAALLPRQSDQTRQPILCDPPLRSSVRYTGGLHYGAQWLVLFKIRLEQTKTIKRELPNVCRDSAELIHTRRVRQIMLTESRQIILKVTRWAAIALIMAPSPGLTATALEGRRLSFRAAHDEGPEARLSAELFSS